MLLYNNRSFFRILVEQKGSVLLRGKNLISGFVLAGFAAFMQHLVFERSRWAPSLPHQFGLQSVGAMVTFAVVFRTNLGWQRYWEAVSNLHFTYARWVDAYAQFHSFAKVSIRRCDPNAEEKKQRLEHAINYLRGKFCILSAMANDRLVHGDTQAMEKLNEKTRFGQGPTLETKLRKMPRYDSLPIFELFHRTSCRQNCSHEQWDVHYITTALPTTEEIDTLTKSSDRTTTVMYWIINCISELSRDIDIAPPIQSRMFQEISNGMNGLNSCVKIADVPFPFPYAQVLNLMITFYSAIVPVYMVCFTQSSILSPLLTFLLFQGLWCINEVAIELENPFGPDANDISLADFHAKFVDALSDIAACHEVAQHCLPSARPATPAAGMGATRTFTNVPTTKESAASSAGAATKGPSPGSAMVAAHFKVLDEDMPRVEDLKCATRMLVNQDGPSTLSQLTATSFDGKLMPGRERSPLKHAPYVDSLTSACPSSPGRERENSLGFPQTRSDLDNRLLQINARMEQHLAHIVHELGSISMAVAAASAAHDGRSHHLRQSV